jgi:hypothetical protein
MPTASYNARHPAIRVRDKDHEAVRQIAEAEGRTILGVLSLAIKHYMAQNQPQLMASLYGHDVPVNRPTKIEIAQAVRNRRKA